MSRVRVSIIASLEYPIHDDDGYLEFMLGMWHNTRDLAGLPSADEVLEATREWPDARRLELVKIMAKHGQITA